MVLWSLEFALSLFFRYHYFTQPNPNPAAWYAHALPRWFHVFSCFMNHAVEAALPAMPTPATHAISKLLKARGIVSEVGEISSKIHCELPT